MNWKLLCFMLSAGLNISVLFILGHEDRVLSLILSPDCSTIATVAGDETIRLWNSFELDPVKKKAKERMAKPTSSVIHQSIR